ncbi:MAG: class I SAM-dependent methyltransferase [Deltaproteobacteria bacterium]|nr:class I SAM-dependent methyltransferase [Deltaproteobacteria bacterium]
MKKLSDTTYRCNITGQYFTLENQDKGREKCNRFGFTSRDRAIVYCLLNKLGYFKQILNKIKNPQITGIGMTDSPALSKALYGSFSYTNTFFHQEPLLDIYNLKHINQFKNLDFIICSEVFEHISPYPGLDIAFSNLYNMLKQNNGILIFSVPYNLQKHYEHFPALYNYQIINQNNNYILYNTTIEEKKEQFTDLIFHGGPGETLEMRQFSKQSLEKYLSEAGFNHITFHDIDQDMQEFGIFWELPISLIISAETI